MKNIIILLCFYLSISYQSSADSGTEIKNINKQVAQIEDEKRELSVLEVKLHTQEFEAVPPEVMYYYKIDSMELVMLKVVVGHEIFSTKHTYYFSNGRVIKYLKESFNHPDNPPKKALIYNNKGDVLFKNIDKPVLSEADVVKLFNNSISALKAFSRY